MLAVELSNIVHPRSSHFSLLSSGAAAAHSLYAILNPFAIYYTSLISSKLVIHIPPKTPFCKMSQSMSNCVIDKLSGELLKIVLLEGVINAIPLASRHNKKRNFSRTLKFHATCKALRNTSWGTFAKVVGSILFDIGSKCSVESFMATSGNTHSAPWITELIFACCITQNDERTSLWSDIIEFGVGNRIYSLSHQKGTLLSCIDATQHV
jgi:hypothetical protein